MRRIGIFFLGFFYLVSALEATTLTWNTDGDGDWAVNSNWIPENIPASADNVILGNIISEPSTINLPSSAQCGSLSFTSAQPYTMSDGSLEVFLGSIQVGLPARNHIINSNIKLVHDLTFLSDDPSSILTISGDISEVFQIVAQTGTIVLSGNNTHEGNIIESGTLQVSSDNNLGIPSSDIRFFGNGTLKSTGDITANRPITLPAGGQAGTLMIDGSTTFTAADTISGAGFLVKDGTGTLVLDVPNNTFTAPARLDDGILQISSDNQLGTSGSLTLNGGTLRATENILSNRVITLLKPTLIDVVTARDLEFDHEIQGDGSITKIGGGTLLLTGTNSYTGGTTLTEGYIFFFNSSNFGTQGLLMDGGGLAPASASSDLLIEILSTGTLETSGSYTATGVISGDGSLTIQGAGPTTLLATNTYKGGTKINVTEVIVTSDSNLGDPLGPLSLDNGTLHVVTTPNLTTNRNITLANTATLETDAGVALQLSGKLDGTGKLVKTGDGALNLGVFSHEYSGGTKLSAGILEIGATGNFGTGQVEFAGGELSTIFDTQINVGATVSAPTTISANNGAILTWAGPIDGSAALTYDGPGTLFLTNNNSYSGPVTVSSGTLALTAPAINSGITNHSIVTFNDDSSGTFLGNISGTGIVKKEGTGTITLFNVNTYSGATQFNEGTLKISATNQLGPNTLVFDGGTLGTSVTLVDTHDITLSSKGSFVVPLGLALTLNGSINGGGTLINPGPGGLIINASNTYTGGTQLTGGLIQIGDSLSLGTGSITVDDGTLFTSTNIALDNLFTLNGNSYFEVVSDTLTLKSNISGDGTLIKTQLGTLNLGSTAKDYTGGTQINTGTVIINMSDNLGTGPVSINNATLNSTGTFPVSNPFTLVNNTTFDVDSGQTLSLTGTIEGNGTLVKIGDGTLNLGSSAHTYSGGTTLTTGILQINSAESLGAGDIDFNGGDLIAVGNFTIEANAALNAPSTITTSDTLTWNGIISGGSTLKKDGSGTLILFGDNSYSGGTTITAGTLTGTTDGIQGNILNNNTLIFDQTSPGSYNDVISGPGQVIKEGPGTVILTNNNLYLGDTLFNNGAFQISTNTQLGPGTFKFNGGFLQTTADIIDSHSITLNTNGVFSTNNSTTLTLNGSIDGGGTLTKVGSGTLDLGAAAHTYSGGTFINDGTLRINVDNTLGTGPVSFFGGTLQSTADIGIALSTAFDADAIISTNSGTTLTWGGTLSGSKRLFKEGDGTLILTANNTNSGGITISSGTLEGTTNSIKGDIANNSTLNFNQTITGTYSGVISGGGSVDVTGPGTVTLEGANTYSGGTTITNGILIGDAESLQGSIANGSALVFDQVFEEVFNGTISGTGSITKKGFGSLFITSDQPFTGLLTINEGAIDLSSTLSGDVFVSNGGHFTGNGQVNYLTNEGIVSIRPKISSSNVLGTYIQKPSGNLVIELNDLGANDMLNIVGNASLDGTLNVALLPGIYEGGTLYTLLTAANVTPGFTNIISRVPGDLFLNYFPTYVEIELTFRGAILPVPIDDLPHNARQVAKYLFCPGFFPDNADLLTVMRQLTTLSPDNFIKELDELSPSQFGALPVTELQNNHLIADTITSHVESYYWCNDCKNRETCPPIEDETTVWITPVAQWQHEHGYEEQLGFNTSTFGFSLGASHLFSSWLHFSTGAGYSHTSLGWKENGGKGSWDSIYLAPSIGFVNKRWYCNFLMQGSFNYYDIKREIRFPGLARTARNHHHSYGVLGRFDSGYKITFTNTENDHPLSVIPTFRLSYLNLFEEGYTESGAGSINLKVDPKYSAFLQPELLIKLLKEVYMNHSCLSTALYLGYVSNVQLSSANYTSRFAVDEPFCKSDFTVRSFNKTTNQLLVGVNLLLKMAHQFEIGLDYEGRFFDNLYINSARFHIDKKF